MDVDRPKVAAAKASVKEAIGKITGDTRLEAKGSADKVAGNTEAAAGSVRSAAHETQDLKSKP